MANSFRTNLSKSQVNSLENILFEAVDNRFMLYQYVKELNMYDICNYNLVGRYYPENKKYQYVDYVSGQDELFKYYKKVNGGK